jgi:hypothetical protein
MKAKGSAKRRKPRSWRSEIRKNAGIQPKAIPVILTTDQECDVCNPHPGTKLGRSYARAG